MSLTEFYTRIGGDYEEVICRLMNEEFIKKLLNKFLEDNSYTLLMENVGSNNEAAFRAVHTLKGVCLNLGLGKLYESSVAVTEALRNGKCEVTKEMLEDISKDYQLTSELINELD